MNTNGLKVNYLAVGVSALVVFVASSLWYSPLLFGNVWMALRGLDPGAVSVNPMPVEAILGELARSLVVAYVLAHLIGRLGIANWGSAVRLGFWVWIGFPVMILAGSVMWENAP